MMELKWDGSPRIFWRKCKLNYQQLSEMWSLFATVNILRDFLSNSFCCYKKRYSTLMFKLLVFKADSKDFNHGAKLNWKANLFVLTEAWLYELTKICIQFAKSQVVSDTHYWKIQLCVLSPTNKFITWITCILMFISFRSPWCIKFRKLMTLCRFSSNKSEFI